MEEKMYVLIAGGRDFDNYEILKKCVNEQLKENTLPVVEISGTATGADKMGEAWAAEKGYEIVRYKPAWDSLGAKAGPLRNIEMYNFIKDKKFKKIILFWDGRSTGTKHMLTIAKNGDLPISLYRYDGELM